MWVQKLYFIPWLRYPFLREFSPPENKPLTYWSFPIHQVPNFSSSSSAFSYVQLLVLVKMLIWIFSLSLSLFLSLGRTMIAMKKTFLKAKYKTFEMKILFHMAMMQWCCYGDKQWERIYSIKLMQDNACSLSAELK